MPDSNYPFGQEQRLFEQNGWLKAEIERLRTDMVTEPDLMRLEKRLDEAAAQRAKDLTRELREDLDRAFERGIPGTQQLVNTEVKKIQDQDQQQFEDQLKRAGLEFKEDGTIGPKIHPFRSAVKRNAQLVLFGVGVAAAANPEQAIHYFRLGWQLVF